MDGLREPPNIDRDFGGIHDQELASTVVAAGVLLTFGAPAAQAAPLPAPFTITENPSTSAVYTCDQTGDTFFAQKNVFAAFNEDESSTSTGPITLHGGTGAFTELTGHGVDDGSVTPNGIGEGNNGVLKLR